MKYIIYILCLIAILAIFLFLNIISRGNVTGIGLGDHIFRFIALGYLETTIRKEVLYKEKK